MFIEIKFYYIDQKNYLVCSITLLFPHSPTPPYTEEKLALFP